MELTIPLLGALMINALHDHRPTMVIWGIAFVAFCVWVLHGSLLAYAIDYTEGKQFSLPARQYLSIYALTQILGKMPEDVREDPALMQVIIERGETVTVDWAVSIIRVVIPLTLPFLFVLTMLFTSHCCPVRVRRHMAVDLLWHDAVEGGISQPGFVGRTG
jgi:hypothetical protein